MPGANIGERAAVFEAVHGTAPDIAGQGHRESDGAHAGAVMMLHHIGEGTAARRVEEAVITLYREGRVRTGDLGGTATTRDYTDALCKLVS